MPAEKIPGWIGFLDGKIDNLINETKTEIEGPRKEIDHRFGGLELS